ncbi:hypothetical protein HanXRQr2_Chr12g0526281 [Helianthus annuus]|uniref:Uncharacterized protein n=1 Tax=Helianthus annuus TaxID=4232 RepID=A0A9K3HD87_HELAN|nr:hypothetical protein HanXRQr2_Chr12g0526281 [Helianthus annuus]KAJ0488297.1 hypothetical protein HanHA300_Chr12g0431371 [Helianthus annuus]KAJ0491745.1 hypothetical protein HanIR_Chr12g0567171 [Helianthus annuus]KAJ0504135.1 hypothetical protein HanHA89_Chr12g0455961 [Helianthus annuus]KAJ0673823.1 hypothetical protein HanLR1_Chr12g0433241 [Helianthus annuus]
MLKQKKLHQTHTKVCVWSISTQGRHKGFPTTLIQSISIKLKPLISLKSSFKHEIVITSLKGSQGKESGPSSGHAGGDTRLKGVL